MTNQQNDEVARRVIDLSDKDIESWVNFNSELVTNETNRLYVTSKLYPCGELIAGGEVDEWLSRKIQHALAEARLQPIPMVNGLDCPACGHPTLILGEGGFITCSLEGCPNPDYAEALALRGKQ